MQYHFLDVVVIGGIGNLSLEPLGTTATSGHIMLVTGKIKQEGKVGTDRQSNQPSTGPTPVLL